MLRKQIDSDEEPPLKRRTEYITTPFSSYIGSKSCHPNKVCVTCQEPFVAYCLILVGSSVKR